VNQLFHCAKGQVGNSEKSGIEVMNEAPAIRSLFSHSKASAWWTIRLGLRMAESYRRSARIVRIFPFPQEFSAARPLGIPALCYTEGMKTTILLLALLFAAPSFAAPAKPLPPFVNKVSRLRYEVSKSRMEKDVKDPQAQLNTFRALPSLGFGYMAGISVSHFSKDCLLPRFGIQEGDVIETVNGQQLGGPGDILEVGRKLAKARVGAKVRVNIKRGDDDVIQTYLLVE
jgi:hypothetical protein